MDSTVPHSPPRRRRRITTILRRLASGSADTPLTVARLQAELGERAAPAMMVILGALNLIPAPPGTSALLGPPIVFFAVQLLSGSPHPWLPKWVLDRTIPRPLITAVEPRLGQRLKKIEATMRPRLTFLASPVATKAVGVLCLVLAVILALPIPLGNFLPGLAIALLALGLMGTDGLFILAGLGVSVAALAVIAGPLYALLHASRYLLT